MATAAIFSPSPMPRTALARVDGGALRIALREHARLRRRIEATAGCILCRYRIAELRIGGRGGRFGGSHGRWRYALGSGPGRYRGFFQSAVPQGMIPIGIAAATQQQAQTQAVTVGHGRDHNVKSAYCKRTIAEYSAPDGCSGKHFLDLGGQLFEAERL